MLLQIGRLLLLLALSGFFVAYMVTGDQLAFGRFVALSLIYVVESVGRILDMLKYGSD
jgi:hypothetical protein